MPSGDAGQAGAEGTGVARVEAAFAQERANLGGAAAMDQAGAAVERERGGRRC
jgi:hypothetical protein